jgi:hypothetical protein
MIGFHYDPEPLKMDHLKNQSEISSVRFPMSVSNICADQTDNPNMVTHHDVGQPKTNSQKSRLTLIIKQRSMIGIRCDPFVAHCCVAALTNIC